MITWHITMNNTWSFHLLSLQIGAYDQQIWEKSVEQREIKVCWFICGLLSISVFHCFTVGTFFPVCFLSVCGLLFFPFFASHYFFCPFFDFSSSSFDCVAFHGASNYFPVISFTSLLSGCHLPICPLLTSILLCSPPSLPPLYSLFLWWVCSRADDLLYPTEHVFSPTL